jgi:acetyl-CoA acetyltransferase
MIKTAQNVSDRCELTREEIDAFALRSHQHAAAARDSGSRPTEEVPVDGKDSRCKAGTYDGQDAGSALDARY